MRYVIDVGTALVLVRNADAVDPAHELLAPTLFRSQVLSALHEAVHRGELSADQAQEQLVRVRELRPRLLGDAVLQRVAWQVADQLGWGPTFQAEYIALTMLQGDALVTSDPELATAAAQFVEVAGPGALTARP